MCPFCIGAATWAAAGVISAGGLAGLAAVVSGQRKADAARASSADREDGERIERIPVG
jgi:hypothetical protein